VITEPRSLGSNAIPNGIVSGPGQHVSAVLTGSNEIDQVAINGGPNSDLFFPILTSQSTPQSIVSSGNGSFAFTELNGNKIGRLDRHLNMQEFPVPTSLSEPRGITNGGAGMVVFTEFIGNKIGFLTLS
jgi:virginiamycin B lyase